MLLVKKKKKSKKRIFPIVNMVEGSQHDNVTNTIMCVVCIYKTYTKGLHPRLILPFQLQQICKILNAHMDSLQWVEQNSGEYVLKISAVCFESDMSILWATSDYVQYTVLLQRRVEEVSKLCESRSKEHEKSFRLNFQWSSREALM